MAKSVNDLDSAVKMMEMRLKSYYQRREQDGEERADGVRMEFAGAKRMLEAYAGKEAKTADI